MIVVCRTAERRAKSLHYQMCLMTPALHSSPVEPAAACSLSNTCYSSDAAAAAISTQYLENTQQQSTREEMPTLTVIMITYYNINTNL